jgi:hypothetical protein
MPGLTFGVFFHNLHRREPSHTQTKARTMAIVLA